MSKRHKAPQAVSGTAAITFDPHQTEEMAEELLPDERDEETPPPPQIEKTTAEIFAQEVQAMGSLIGIMKRIHQLNANQSIQLIGMTLNYHLTRAQLRSQLPFNPGMATPPSEEVPDGQED